MPHVVPDSTPTFRQAARAGQARLADCDGKLARYRQAIDAGTDPATLAAWIAEVNAERASAERELAAADPAETLSADGIERLAAWFAGSADRFHQAMNAASAEARQALYDSLRLQARFTPGADAIEIALSPAGDRGRVGGGT